MNIHAADALMEIFGFKRVANDEKPLDNPPSLDDDGGSLNEGMEMSEVKNEGLEVVAWQFKQNGKWYLGSNTNDHKSNTISAGYPVRELCLLDKALAGYAVRDARIAAQEAQIKALQSDANSWQSGYDEGRRMGGKHCMLTVDQLRAELAALNAKIDAPVAKQVVMPELWQSAVNNVAGYAHLFNSGCGIISEIRAEHARLNTADQAEGGQDE